MADKTQRRTLRLGDRIADFIVAGLLGQGGFGDIYYVESKVEPGKTYAMKIEPVDFKGNGLLNERSILQQIQGSPYFPKYLDSGHTLFFRYLVMECLGPSLSDVRRVLPDRRFLLSTVLRLGIETLRAIQSFHEKGFIHRDIKPSNFLLRPGKPTPIALIDFGLARRYVHRSNGELIPPRHHAGFVGTTKYASLNAHEGMELGRRDDVFSWLFSLFEMATGTLPWVISRDRHETYESKQGADIAGFCAQMPPQILAIYEHIATYSFEDEPRYDFIISLLVEAMDDANCGWDDPFDWEGLSDDDCARISPAIPLQSQHNDYPQPSRLIPEPRRPTAPPSPSNSISGSYAESEGEKEPKRPKRPQPSPVKRKGKHPVASAPNRQPCNVL
jgi:serine/threonine protein kinase